MLAVVTDTNNTVITVIVADRAAVRGLGENVASVDLVEGTSLTGTDAVCIVVKRDVVVLLQQANSVPSEVVIAVGRGVAHAVVYNGSSIIRYQSVLPSGGVVGIALI